MKPIITIVSGTINRLSLLQRMVQSARREARGLPIDFIIVDNGSADGTESWCMSQPDITFLQMGKAVGGIKAFTEGGKLSTARYTILANDDIKFLPYSIVTAYRVLEDNPTCGAVAFADNRLAKDQDNPTYATQKHPTRNQYGDIVWTTYAQVGMYRTPLMIACNIWGGDDSLFGGAGAWTYGGDNYLSAKIFEYGYHICTHPTVKIHDYIHADEVRTVGNSKHPNDAKLYHDRFGRGGAVWASKQAEALAVNTEGALRVLYLPEIEPIPNSKQLSQMTGLYDAMVKAGWDVIRYCHTLEAIADISKMRETLYNLVVTYKPHLLFMQLHSANLITGDMLSAIRASHPSMVIVNWNGDYWREKLFAPTMLDLLKNVDVQLVVDNAVIPRYAELDITARYWQVAPETPYMLGSIADTLPHHDILFMGTIYSDERKDLITFLDKFRKEGLDVGLYGGRYPKGVKSQGTTYYDYATAHALMRNAGVVIGGMEFDDTDGYVSNRLFECLQAGGVLLQQTLVNADVHMGIIGGVHCAWWDSLDDLEGLIRYYLRERQIALDMAGRGHELVTTHHQWDNRIDELIKILEEMK